MARLEVFCSCVPGIGVENGDVGWIAREILDSQFNRTAVFSTIVFRDNVERCGARSDTPLEETYKPVGAVYRQIVRRSCAPGICQLLARFDRVSTHIISRIPGTHLKHNGCATRVEECESDGRPTHVRMNI